jgi:hypothetical protein
LPRTDYAIEEIASVLEITPEDVLVLVGVGVLCVFPVEEASV